MYIIKMAVQKFVDWVTPKVHFRTRLNTKKALSYLLNHSGEMIAVFVPKNGVEARLWKQAVQDKEKYVKETTWTKLGEEIVEFKNESKLKFIYFCLATRVHGKPNYWIVKKEER